nr:hypothetical protein CFP56_60766 [Quercus suber]
MANMSYRWYTDHMPNSDAQVAAHFSTKRPVLGICLKRYSYTQTGQAVKLNTYVDIPLEIAVPNFVGDDSMHEDGPLAGNFRLVLQSVVCHRGVSVHSGHYVTLCRGRLANLHSRCSQTDHNDVSDDEDDEDPWMRFDDLAKERVTNVDIRHALKQETPYLLFYQVQPIDDDGQSIHDLPSYAEATSRSQSNVEIQEKTYSHESSGSEYIPAQSMAALHSDRGRMGVADFAPQSSRNSLDVNVALENDTRGRSSISVSGDERRGSFNFPDSSFESSATSVRTDHTSTSVPSTPPDEKAGGFLTVASKIGSKRGSRRSKSRPASAGQDNPSRFSLNMNMTKFARGLSNKPEISVERDTASTALDNKTPAVISSIILPTADDSKESVTMTAPAPNGKIEKEAKKKKKEDKRARVKAGDGDDRDCVVM